MVALTCNDCQVPTIMFSQGLEANWLEVVEHSKEFHGKCQKTRDKYKQNSKRTDSVAKRLQCGQTFYVFNGSRKFDPKNILLRKCKPRTSPCG